MTDEVVQKVRGWIRVAAEILGADLELPQEGASSLLISKDFVVAIDVPDEGDCFYLCTPLGKSAVDTFEEGYALLQKALEANAFQAKTQGGSVGLGPSDGLFVYSLKRTCIGCDEQIFTETVALFYEAALDLRTTLQLTPLGKS